MTQKQLDESTAYLQSKGFDNPEIGIVLGTGLGKLADEIENPLEPTTIIFPFFLWRPLSFIPVN